MNLYFNKNMSFHLHTIFNVFIKLLPISLISYLASEEVLISKNNNNYFNCIELVVNRSSITTKLLNINNGYLFIQYGHNLSLYKGLKSQNIKLIDKIKEFKLGGGSLYLDLSYRYLFNKLFYINFGGGIKIGALSINRDSRESVIKDLTNLGFGFFIGIKHKYMIESSIQIDFPINNIRMKKGLIGNFKFKNFISIESGLSNLYTQKDEWNTFFSVIRFNIGCIGDYLGDYVKFITRYINAQILLMVDKNILVDLNNNKGRIFSFELTIGFLRVDKNLIDGYRGIDEILKNNTMEYGLIKQTNILEQLLLKEEYERLNQSEQLLSKALN